MAALTSPCNKQLMPHPPSPPPILAVLPLLLPSAKLPFSSGPLPSLCQSALSPGQPGPRPSPAARARRNLRGPPTRLQRSSTALPSKPSSVPPARPPVQLALASRPPASPKDKSTSPIIDDYSPSASRPAGLASARHSFSLTHCRTNTRFNHVARVPSAPRPSL
jgi:hypothetical protein